MPAVSSTTIPVNTAYRARAVVEISLLPKQSYNHASPLLDNSGQPSARAEAQIELLEASEYRYQFHDADTDGAWSTDRPEIFQPDTVDGRSGRVRTGSYTGWLPVAVFRDGRELGTLSFEVRSRKLGYLGEYQWMLRDIAETVAEIVMSHFAVTELRFSIDDSRDAVTLYQRFAFLRTLIASDSFHAAIREIIKRPHVSWIQIDERVHPGQGMRATSQVARQMAKPGARSVWTGHPIGTIPEELVRERTEVSLDTTPNRFVKFVLMRWRGVVSQVRDVLRKGTTGAVQQRGEREATHLLDDLDAVLSEELFREVGQLRRFPGDDQVLQKREGYRDVLHAYIQFEVASKLAWSGGEDVYGAGQRDVATLYEYWVFLKLGQVVSQLCDVTFDFSNLIEVREDGLNLNLRRGKTKAVSGIAHRSGRTLTVELWFNRQFVSSEHVASESSWSERMRPDYTLRISPATNKAAAFEPVLLHFDAKYRLQFVEDIFGRSEDLTEDLEEEVTLAGEATALRSDLLKMHAYRDAIRRSAGAYVLYPGNAEKLCREYHELLPGLGAFALRPTESGSANGSQAITRFIEDVFEHIASQITQHERARFWLREVFGRPAPATRRARAANFLVAPPADTQVLLGHVKNAEHWQWVHAIKSYNLRADARRGSVGLNSRELACDLTVLSCPELDRTVLAQVVGAPQLRSASQLEHTGYPNPRGELYYCFTLELLNSDRWENLLNCDLVERIRSNRTPVQGAPVAITWLDLVMAVT